MALEVVTSRTMKERQLKLIYMTVVVKLEAVLTTKVELDFNFTSKCRTAHIGTKTIAKIH